MLDEFEVAPEVILRIHSFPRPRLARSSWLVARSSDPKEALSATSHQLPNVSAHHAQSVRLGSVFPARGAVAILHHHIAFAGCQKQIRLQPVLLRVQIVVASPHLVEFFVSTAL